MRFAIVRNRKFIEITLRFLNNWDRAHYQLKETISLDKYKIETYVCFKTKEIALGNQTNYKNKIEK